MYTQPMFFFGGGYMFSRKKSNSSGVSIYLHTYTLEFSRDIRDITQTATFLKELLFVLRLFLG